MNKVNAYAIVDKRTEVIEKYAPLVKRIAYHLMLRLPASVQVDDLIQVGLIGLLEATSNFDSTKAAKFETFAGIRIRGAMLDEIRRNDWVPRSVYKNNRQVMQAIDEIEQETGREAKDFEVAEKLNISLNEYHSILNDVSVGKVIGIEDLGVSLDVFQQDFEDNNIFKELSEVQFKKALTDAIKQLKEKDALVLSLYYDEALNLKEIGAVLDISESRVSQILSQAVIKLKAKLKEWTDE